MKLKELMKELETIANDDPKNLEKDVEVTGAYASVGDIFKVYVSAYLKVTLQTDVCSG